MLMLLQQSRRQSRILAAFCDTLTPKRLLVKLCVPTATQPVEGRV